jgi:O-antigen ligase
MSVAYLKDFVYTFALCTFAFAIAKPVALQFMEELDFKRRRNVWLFLTAAAFLCPTFWWFALVAVPTLFWAGKKDPNPLALDLVLMNVIPQISIQIPTVGIQQLFPIDIYRTLSLCVMVPAALRLRNRPNPDRIRGLQKMDLFLLGLGLLQALLYAPPDLKSHIILHNSFTNFLRESFLYVIDIYVLYYVASRLCTTRRTIMEAMAAFCLSCSVMAVVAVFESGKHWLLYTALVPHWGGDPLMTQYLYRGGLLRTEASTGNPLALGFLLSVSLGFWLYLKSRVSSWRWRIGATVLMSLGLLVSFSRGPWFAAIVMVFAYAAFGPRGTSRLVKAGLGFLLISSILLASPLGSKITGMVPFLGGKVGASSVTYRERLLDRSWQLIKAKPILGDQDALSKMQDLRQGQGLIDVVDAYVQVTLFYGFVGLALFLFFILSGLMKAYRAAKRAARTDPDSSLLGASIAASIFGMLLLLADGSLGTGPQRIFYVTIGLATAYAHLIRSQKPAESAAQSSASETKDESLATI